MYDLVLFSRLCLPKGHITLYQTLLIVGMMWWVLIGLQSHVMPGEDQVIVT